MKAKWDNKVLKWFFGVPGVIDERVKNEIGHYAIKTVIILLGFETLFFLGSFVYATEFIHDFENFFYITTIIQFFAVLWIVVLFAIRPLHRTGITDQEVTKQSKTKYVKTLRSRWLKMIPLTFVSFWFLSSIFEFSSQSLISILFSSAELGESLLFTIFFNGAMYFWEKSHVRIIEDDSFK